MTTLILGLGTNLGDRGKMLSEAIRKIEEEVGNVSKVSSVYETEPWGFSSENLFLNVVLTCETKLEVSGVLGRILMIESIMGRLRTQERYTSRVIDIDILFFGDTVIDEAELKVPHPRLQERKFVLLPLNEIVPELIHPVLGLTISQLLVSCKDECVVKKIQSSPLSAKL
jgi:2-amino-4-hydroxy-6-hydroxymethyldihydropteridine diphosphokinase